MAALGSDQVDFGTLRDALEATDSAVSKGIYTLEEAGYVKTTKGYFGNRPRTWVVTTAKGRSAYERHLAALRAIAGS